MDAERRQIPDALAVAFLTVLAYLAAYRFEEGYIGYFGVSKEAIHVSLDMTIRAGIGILTSFTSIMLTVNGIVELMHRGLDHPHRGARLLAGGALMVIVSAILFQYAFGNTRTFAVLTALTLFLVVLPIALGLVAGLMRKHATWLDRIEDSLRTEAPDAWSRIIGRFGRRVFLGFMGLLLATLASWLLGIGVARKTTSFEVAGETGQALIRIYGDTAVLKDFDLSNKRILNVTHYATMEELSHLTFRSMSLTGMTVEEPPKAMAASTAEPLVD